MKKVYTKKQILEAIKHWTKVLDESKSPLLDDLVAEFGEDTVLSRGLHDKIRLTESIVDKTYNVVNKWLFGNKLHAPEIDIEESREYFSAGAHHLASYSFECFSMNGKLVLLTRRVRTPDGVVHKPPRILIPVMLIQTKMPYMFFANIIAHEMIHQFDVELGNELQKMQEDEEAGKPHDPHGEVFQKFMNDANQEFGMNIKISVDNMGSEFMQSVMAAKKKLEEDEGFIKSDDKVLTDSEFLTTIDKGNGFIQAKLY